MDLVKLDIEVYNLAWEYLLNLDIEGVDKNLIAKYQTFPLDIDPPETLKDIYLQILKSAQNANMKAGVIGKSIDGVNNLGAALFDFNPEKVLQKYNSWDLLLDEIESKINPRGQIRRTSRSIWPKYCETILSAANFIVQFETANDFYEWIEFFNKDDRARPALPMMLSQEISGLGFALACDFLMELGYINFAKPDVHIRDIFQELRLCKLNTSNYNLFKAVLRVATHVNMSPYATDKLFWLVGSGNFYDDPDIGKTGRILPSPKPGFISTAKSKLKELFDDWDSYIVA